jgi:NitT/TauT family transport system ATP-binding protein
VGSEADVTSKIAIADVSHRFDGVGQPDEPGVADPYVLRDISFSVAEGEFVSIIGPSGCGKTTALNMLAGFIKASEGSVRIDGQEVDGVQSGRVAFMFSQDALYPWRTALENVLFPLECGLAKRHLQGKSAADYAGELLELVGLGAARGKYPHQLSQGMRQRVALARMIACDSDILLMDEPFGALDAQTRVVVQAEFSRIWEQYSKTVLMVTHDLTEAIALSDRIVVMSHRPGRIKRIYEVGIERPRSVLDLPTTKRFHELYAALWDDLRPELAGAR